MNTESNDPTLLKIRGRSNFNENDPNDFARKDYLKKLSSAILTVISKHGSAKLKAVGAPAINNAMKAIIMARGEGMKEGLDLVIEPSFDNATFDNNIKTAVVLKVINKKG